MDKLTRKAPTKGDVAAVLASAAIPIFALLWGMQSGNPYGYFIFLRIVGPNRAGPAQRPDSVK